MASNDIERALSDSAAEVLETMFFTTLLEDGEPVADSAGQWISAQLSFHGNPPGHFGIRIPLATGRRLAANFLGLEEQTLTGQQINEVTSELANMLSGSVLSRLEKGSSFVLSQPEVESSEAASPPGVTAQQTFQLQEGPLAIWLELERAA